MKYRCVRRIREPVCTPIPEWIEAYQTRRQFRPTILGAVAVFESRLCAIAMVQGVVQAAPLDLGVLPRFRDALSPAHRKVYGEWVASFQAGELQNPAPKVLAF